jgi:hypothetical protein
MSSQPPSSRSTSASGRRGPPLFRSASISQPNPAVAVPAVAVPTSQPGKSRRGAANWNKNGDVEALCNVMDQLNKSNTYPRSTAQWEVALAMFHTQRRDKRSGKRSLKSFKQKWAALCHPPPRSGQTEFDEFEQLAQSIQQDANEKAGVGIYGSVSVDVDSGSDMGGDEDRLSEVDEAQPQLVEDDDVRAEIAESQLVPEVSNPPSQNQHVNEHVNGSSQIRSAPLPSSSASVGSQPSTPSSIRSRMAPVVPLLNDPTFQKRSSMQKKEDDTTSLLQYMVMRDEERRREEKLDRDRAIELELERRKEERKEREAREDKLRTEEREERRRLENREDRLLMHQERLAQQHQDMLMFLLGRGPAVGVGGARSTGMPSTSPLMNEGSSVDDISRPSPSY